MDRIDAMGTKGKTISELLSFIYGDKGEEARLLLLSVINKYEASGLLKNEVSINNKDTKSFSEKDALLITYGDMISDYCCKGSSDKKSPLQRLYSFIEKYFPNLFTFIHILPFYPYSSDDGFSVIDYKLVNPNLGTWDDIKQFSQKYKLVFDLVLNHTSSKSKWFTNFCEGKYPYSKFFITRPLDYDYSTVLRPRTHPLITKFVMANGKEIGLWTTFSNDQLDLNFSSPEVFVEFIDIILFYISMGAKMLRLDAIAYLWKQDNTSCAHLPKTHAVVKAIKAIVSGLGLDISILTETNVPHKENISYFGNNDEADIVYNFSLPPLVLHSFVTEDVEALSNWASSLYIPQGKILLNFLASHDGIGVSPAKGLIPNFEQTIEKLKNKSALVSMKSTADGEIPYEINFSWCDAVSPDDASDFERACALSSSYAIACAMDGLPAFYFHSVVGSRSWFTGKKLLGYNRAVNREKPCIDILEKEISLNNSIRNLSLKYISNLLTERANHKAFSPYANRRVHSKKGKVFMIERFTEGETILVLVNCSRKNSQIDLPEQFAKSKKAFDPMNKQYLEISSNVDLKPYSVLWVI